MKSTTSPARPTSVRLGLVQAACTGDREANIRQALAGIAAFSLLAATGAHAQSFPVKPVRIISPFEAGGSNDGVIRPVGPRMGELLGQQVLVENRPGAGGVVGSEVVARVADALLPRTCGARHSLRLVASRACTAASPKHPGRF